ncbi:LAGLIDADG family homing endonuclease [Kitasatospora sp. LaBMicrA B282]|uniref:LAGLIDADG family homing endonuclease n=1 Tax=Kitasatospora sp. LaBMicrA B282 TaxID=3420949 RepID=UPI003D0FAA1A
MAYFDLQNPDHAYAFGFLQADGHLHQGPGRKGQLTVEINAHDRPLLESFQRLFPVNSSITERCRSTNFATRSETAVWSVCALDFREELKALGLPAGRKSATIAPPQLPHSERDYLRGLIDADGSLGRTAAGLPFVSLTTDSTEVIWYFSNYMKQLTGVVHTPRRNRRDQIYNLIYTIEDAVELARTLYYPGCLALPRKATASEFVASWLRPPGMRRQVEPRRSWTADEDDILLAAATPAEAAAQLDRSVKSCVMRHWRLVGPQRSRKRSVPSGATVSP